jgi:hypothetical protein
MSKATSTSHFNFSADAAEMHRHAYNAAFYELGLRWYWDASIYQHPLPDGPERGRIRNYLENHQRHLLTAYDVEFLADAIQAAKALCYQSLTAGGRPAAPAVNWAEVQQAQVGV